MSTPTSQKCYWVNGDEMPKEFGPCNAGADSSACCMINKDDPDICLSSGLCMAQASGYEGYLFWNGCTDKSGKADGCAQVCGAPPSDISYDSLDVLQCSRGVICCQAFGSKDNCCSDDSALITTEIGRIVAAAKTGSPSTSASTSSSLPSSTSSSGSTAPASCPKDNTAVVGGAVGGVLGAALLASLAALAFLYKRRRDDHRGGRLGGSGEPKPTELPVSPVHELPAQGAQQNPVSY